MASLNGFRSNITGASGSQGLMAPQSSWKVYILPRGAHAASASTGTKITFDSTDAASRFTASNWIQVGTSVDNIRQISSVAGTSMLVNTAVTVAQNDRIFQFSTTQPTVAGGSATYASPGTTIYPRDDDAATSVTNSMLTTDSSGMFEFFAANGFYDALVQDANQANQLGIADLEVGVATTGLLPTTPYSTSIGTCTRPFGNIHVGARIMSGVTSAAGTTAFHFDTCDDWVTGNLFAFGNTGGAAVLYGDTWGGIYNSYTLPRVYNVKSPRFGARGGNDAAIDDTAAIQAALTFAAVDQNGSQSAIVFLPRDTYHITSTLEIPASTRLVGEGRRNSVIKAGDGYTDNTFLVRIGTAAEAALSQNCHGTQIEQLCLDANTKTGSCGVHSTRGQEGSGIFDCLIINFRNTGVSFGDACQNMRIVGAEIAGASTGEVGIRINRVFGPMLLQDVTIYSNTGVSSSEPCVLLSASSVVAQRVHGEYHASVFGLTTHAVGGGGNHLFLGCDTADGVAACDTVIDYFDSSGSFTAINTRQGTASSIIYDRVLGDSIAGIGAVPLYVRSSTGANEELFAPTIEGLPNAIFPDSFRFGCSTTFDRTVGFSGGIMTDIDTIASTGSISMSNRSTVKLTGTASIHTITNGATGQRALFYADNGATPTFTSGNTLFMGGNFVFAGMSACQLLCIDGTSWARVL